MNLPWTNAGLPTLTIPTGFSQSGLPLALQLTGRWQGDEALLAHGKVIEELATNFTNTSTSLSTSDTN
jgi:Asp-tRNA(Asn)/Glu-tRNA(Gln) amidotransferase A subunit family amidase